MRVLLCSLAVPWPSRPRLGIFHVHQARALRELGGEMRIFGPGPHVPGALGALWRRVRDHAARPLCYEIDGVQVDAPRVGFAFPPFVRRWLGPRAPGSVMRWAELAMASELDAAIVRFRPDVLLAHGILPFGRVALTACRRHRIRCAFVEHSADDVFRLRPATRLGRAATACARAADRVFVVGAPMRDWLTRAMGWDNVELLPNGATTMTTAASPRPARLAGRFVVLAAANYYRRKGIEELVDAFDVVASDHADVDLHLVVDDQKRLVRRIAAARHRDRIHLAPPLQPKDLLTTMAWADLFALPSWREAFGLVYAEALAAGTPVLATSDSGFACEAATWASEGNPRPAIVVPPRDHAALVSALSSALSARDALRTMAESGARMVAERFTWKRNAERLCAAFGDVHNRDTKDAAGRPAAFSSSGASAAPNA